MILGSVTWRNSADRYACAMIIGSIQFARRLGIEWGSVAEWATAAVALLALGASIYAVFFALRSDKRHRFFELHDQMTSLESQEGRRILQGKLRSPEAITKVFRRHPEKFDVVNRSVGLYNTLGIYVQKKYIPRDMAIAHWGPQMKLRWPEIETFVRWRRSQTSDPAMWNSLVWFAQESGAPVSQDLRA